MSRRLPSYEERIERHTIPEPNSGCLLWLGPYNDNGYGLARAGAAGKTMGAHRYVWIGTFGDVPDGLEVAHKCDVRCCVNPAHLFLATHAENMRDMVEKGRTVWSARRRQTHFATRPRGSAHSKTHLTDADVIAIRATPSSEGVLKALSITYRVSKRAIWQIRARRTWKHLA